MSENGSHEEYTAVYSTKFVLSKELYCDFGSVGYNRTKTIFWVFLMMTILVNWIYSLSGDYDVILWYGPAISFIMCLTYFRTKQAIKVGYERMVLTRGKEADMHHALYEDKIVAYGDGTARDIFYDQVTKLYETKLFLLLYLKHDVYVTIEKSGLNGSIEAAKAFLMKKCTRVKKKKFIDCSADEKWSLIFLVALIAVAAIGVVAGLV